MSRKVSDELRFPSARFTTAISTPEATRKPGGETARSSRWTPQINSGPKAGGRLRLANRMNEPLHLWGPDPLHKFPNDTYWSRCGKPEPRPLAMGTQHSPPGCGLRPKWLPALAHVRVTKRAVEHLANFNRAFPQLTASETTASREERKTAAPVQPQPHLRGPGLSLR